MSHFKHDDQKAGDQSAHSTRTGSFWDKAVLSVATCLVVLTVSHVWDEFAKKVFSPELAPELREFSRDLQERTEHIEPFHLANLYYGHLLKSRESQSLEPKRFLSQRPSPSQRELPPRPSSRVSDSQFAPISVLAEPPPVATRHRFMHPSSQLFATASPSPTVGPKVWIAERTSIYRVNQQSRANYANKAEKHHISGGLRPRRLVSSVSFYTSLIWSKSCAAFFFTRRQVRSQGWGSVFKQYPLLLWSRSCDAFFFSRRQISSEGWLRAATTGLALVIALVIALAVPCGMFRDGQTGAGANLLLTLLLLPYVASLFAYLLQLPFWLMGALLDWGLNNPKIVVIVGFLSSSVGIYIGPKIFKLLEHILTERIITAFTRAWDYWRGGGKSNEPPSL
jgi:hypothetical protein